MGSGRSDAAAVIQLNMSSVKASAPMRIAMYQGDLPKPGRKPGGVTVHVHRLSEALVQRGHDVTVMTFSQPQTARYRVLRLRPHRAEASRVMRQYVAPWVFNGISFSGFDVAHFHGDDWFYFRRTLPTVRTFHGSALLEARHATSWRRRLDKRAIFPLEKLAGRLATASYAVGSDAEAIYRTEGLLPIGIDLVSGESVRSPNPSILFIGAWRGRKRGSLLHDVFREEVLPAIPGAELWMVSDECESTDGVTWVQAPSDEQLSDLLSRAWVFCMPSSYEGFGIPYLEAMAHRTPVIATPNPGSETILGAGSFGILAEDGDLGQRLIDVLTNDELRDSLSARGRGRAEEYSWERSCELHEAAYLRAIERWRSTRRYGARDRRAST